MICLIFFFYIKITAQNELAGEGVGICDELITLEIMASDVGDLTLIDLPGIARVPVKGQPEDIGYQVSVNCDPLLLQLWSEVYINLHECHHGYGYHSNIGLSMTSLNCYDFFELKYPSIYPLSSA